MEKFTFDLRAGSEKQIVAGNDNKIDRPRKLGTMLTENFSQTAAGQIAVYRAVADFFARHYAEP